MKRAFLVLITLMFLTACTPVSEDIKQLQSVEVREYEGERLDSVGSFRDNSIIGVQYVNISDYKLEITGLVENPLSLTYDEVLKQDKYSKVVTLNCVEGWSRTILWEGILFKDLVAAANVKPEANTVIFYAYDGYSTSHPLDYLIDNNIMIAYKQNDVYLIDNNIMIAYKQNNVTIPPENGFPFQLVAEDKYGIKWIKWITKIELSDDENYRGYWESRGYSQESDIGGSVYD